MKNRTYNNVLRIFNLLRFEKGYNMDEAEKLARQVFDNVEDDRKAGARSAEYFYALILPKSEWLAECGDR